MDVTIGDRRYVLQWQYINNDLETKAFIDGHAPQTTDFHMALDRNTKRVTKLYKGHIPLKKNNVVGMAICRLKVPASDATKAANPKQKLETLYEGYAFRHWTEPTYDKATARRVSLTDAIRHLPQEERTVIWKIYNRNWPPVKAEMDHWHRKYVAVAMENEELKLMLQGRQQFTGRPSVGGPVVQVHKPSADGTGFPG